MEPFSNDGLFSDGKNVEMTFSIANPFNLNIDTNLAPLLARTHSPFFIKTSSSEENKLILIVRNPTESILSSNKMAKKTKT